MREPSLNKLSDSNQSLDINPTHPSTQQSARAPQSVISQIPKTALVPQSAFQRFQTETPTPENAKTQVVVIHGTQLFFDNRVHDSFDQNFDNLTSYLCEIVLGDEEVAGRVVVSVEKSRQQDFEKVQEAVKGWIQDN